MKKRVSSTILLLILVYLQISLGNSTANPTTSSTIDGRSDNANKAWTHPTWYGVGSEWRVFPNSTDIPLHDVLNYWQYDIDHRIEKWGFNTVRLAFAFPNSNASNSVINYDELDHVLALLHANGLSIILDLHNWQDMEGYFGSPEWLHAWTTLAERYKNDTRIVAYELFNEPYGPDRPSRVNTWHTSITGGGSGIDDGTEGVASSLATCVKAIRAVGDNHTIIYPSPYWFRPNEDEILHPERFVASPLYCENVVISMHQWYGRTNQTLEEMYQWLITQQKIMDKWAEYFPVWIGEFGPYLKQPWFTQKTWCTELVNYALSRDIGYNFWVVRSTPEGREETWNLVYEILESSNIRLYTEIDELTAQLDSNIQLYTEINELTTHLEIQNTVYNHLLRSYNELHINFQILNATYHTLLSDCNRLQVYHEIILNELNTIRNLTIVLTATTTVLILMMIYRILIKRRKTP